MATKDLDGWIDAVKMDTLQPACRAMPGGSGSDTRARDEQLPARDPLAAVPLPAERRLALRVTPAAQRP